MPGRDAPARAPRTSGRAPPRGGARSPARAGRTRRRAPGASGRRKGPSRRSSKLPAAVTPNRAATIGRRVGADRRGERLRVPDVEGALFAARVGVLRGEESAACRRHLGAAGSRASRARRGRRRRRRTRGARGRRRGRASRCRRASSRSAARASARRPSSGGSRRRPGRTCRPPPSASSVFSTIARAAGSPVRSQRRIRSSSRIAGGNFGAPPKPPSTGSNWRASAPHGGVERAPAPGARRGRASAAAASASRCASISPAEVSSSSRRVFQAVGDRREELRGTRAGPSAASAGSTCRRRRACPSGVRKSESGQPPLPGHHLDGLHVDVVDVGPLLAVDLDRDEVAVRAPPRRRSFSKDSCSMTWHQWHVE